MSSWTFSAVTSLAGCWRIAIPLVERGVQVDGIDLSPSMLAKLRSKPGSEKMEIVQGNFADVGITGKYRLIYLIFNTFYNLMTQEEQVRCFINVDQHLEEGGVFVIEGGTPTEFYNLTNNQYVHTEAIETNQVRFDVAKFDPVEQLLVENHVTLSENGIRFNPIVTRYVWASEMDLMGRIAGLRLEERWGTWTREPFTGESRNCISVYVKG